MRALVIGGTGPTGPHVIDGLLKRGYEVTIFHRGTHEIDLPKKVRKLALRCRQGSDGRTPLRTTPDARASWGLTETLNPPPAVTRLP